MKYISVLIKPASNLCNMQCNYCFYKDVSKYHEIKDILMDEATIKEIIIKLFDAIEVNGIINIAFQGGEPLLRGIDFYYYVMELINKYNTKNIKVNLVLQTNGILINEKWCELFKKYQFLIGISLDGIKKTHDCHRLKDNQGTYDLVINKIKLLQSYQIPFNVLCVITDELCKYTKEVYNFFKKMQIEYVQFIPCLPFLNTNQGALSPKNLAKFYLDYYKLWEQDLFKSHYQSVGLFDNLLMMLNKQEGLTCGMNGKCHNQLVIEANGDVYPCDFYAISDYFLANIYQTNFNDLVNHPNLNKFIKANNLDNHICNNCTYQSLCKGNCKRNHKIFFLHDKCYYGIILNGIIPRLENLRKKRR